jgi:hypothetical protein
MTRLADSAAHRFRKSVKLGKFAYRRGTASLRALPDFLVIGTQKGGTTYLYKVLSEHPDVLPAFKKEVHYFDLHYDQGEGWYRAYFPLRARLGERTITGEASPYYLFHPHAPGRAAELLPDAKLIVLLRNPVDRAYSHYQHQVTQWAAEGHETLSFEAAVDAEEERLDGELARLMHDDVVHSPNFRSYSYLARGHYVDQLMAWNEVYDRDQMLVLKSEDFFADEPRTLATILDFLGLREWAPERSVSIPNKREYSSLSPALRQRLVDYFEPHNKRLYDYLGTDFGW